VAECFRLQFDPCNNKKKLQPEGGALPAVALRLVACNNKKKLQLV
jgi:hypothetical protein